MATEASAVGTGPGTSLRQDQSGFTQFEETRENGYHKVTSVEPDGTVSTKIDRTDPSTGITSSIERFPDGTISRTTQWPGGQTETKVQLPDGTIEGTRTFHAPDGSTYKQVANADGSLQTTHEKHEPDGTFRQTVKKPDGSVETTLSKSYTDEDGSKVAQTKFPNGDLKTHVDNPDGSSHTTTVHPDGSRDKITVSHTDDGKLVTHEVRADGSESTDTRWMTPDGHEHRTFVGPDGATREYENWEDSLPDGTKVLHFNRPEGNETTTNRPDGSTETVKENSDGTVSTFSRTIEPDGSIHEHQVNSNGAVRDAHFRHNPDGSYTTETRDFDGTNRTTMVGPDGRVEVHEVGPGGTHTDTTYSSDGSGRREITDEDGNIKASMDIEPHPRPIPAGDDPETFLATAERHLPPEIGASELPAPEGAELPSVPLAPDAAENLTKPAIEPPDAGPPEIDTTSATGPPEIDAAATTTPASASGETDAGDDAGFDIQYKMSQGPPGGTTLSIEKPAGTSTLTSVDSETGETFHTAERTNPSTGVITKVERSSTGVVETTIDAPDGTRQVTTQNPDGSVDVFRAFTGPDGTRWSQSTNFEKGTTTTHETFDPDGTQRVTQKLPDGTVQTTTSKTTKLEDGTSVTEVHAPNGDVSIMAVHSETYSESRIIHTDGTQSVTTLTKVEDGSTVTRHTSEDGSVTTQTDWDTPDGHHHETIVHPDGSTQDYESWTDKHPDGSISSTITGPDGSETMTTQADGSYESVKTLPDGRTETHSLTKNPDGSAVERNTLPDGSTSETQYGSLTADGSYTNVTRDFDGTERRTTMERDGSIAVREVNPDGTSSETNYNPEGMGLTTTFDAAGNVTGETMIEPLPEPVPHDFEPEEFLDYAQAEFLPDPGTADAVSGEAEPESRVLSDAEVDLLSERGIAGPIGRGDPTELDDAAIAEPVGAAIGPEVEMPAGALGDPATLTNAFETQQENIITPEPYPTEQVWPGEEKIEGMEPEVEEEIEPVPVDGPEEDIILPEPAEDQVWPEEEQIEGISADEYDPIGPDPAVEPDPAAEPDPALEQPDL